MTEANRSASTVAIPRLHYNAVRRVLALLDGYMSVQKQDVLMAWDGGLMTWRELRQHSRAAIELLPKNPTKKRRAHI